LGSNASTRTVSSVDPVISRCPPCQSRSLRRATRFVRVAFAASGLIVFLDPAQAERMPGGICVDLKVVEGVNLLGRLQHPRTERHDPLVSSLELLDPEVEVDLLRRRPIRPVGRDMVGLNTTAALSGRGGPSV